MAISSKAKINQELLDSIEWKYFSKTELKEKLINTEKLNLAKHQIFTDKFAPVDYFVFKSLEKS